LTYAFDADADYEGRLLGALERMEANEPLRVVEVLFIGREKAGELVAFDIRSRGEGNLTLPLIGFRLDPRERKRMTERALDGMPSELGAALGPGEAMAAVLIEAAVPIEDEWMRALEDAIARVGGTALTSEVVDPTTLVELAPRLTAAAKLNRD
jgi:hypothetical protein